MTPAQMPQRRPQWMNYSFPLAEPRTIREAVEYISTVKVLDKHKHLIRMTLNVTQQS